MQLACLGGSLSSLGPATVVNESVHQSKINLREVLSGLCYKQREKLWEFEVCPFHSVTQGGYELNPYPLRLSAQQQPLVLMGCSQITGPNRYSTTCCIAEFLAYFKAGVMMTTDITGLV